ncbi:MAG TPA: peptidase domain-containing ABC transporter [Puia sp.]|nr:peptidase domain-containing ABC transporter [Puia sp.]
MGFPTYRQLNAMDCGPTCLKMIARFHGKHYNIHGLKQATGFGKDGVSLLGVSTAAENLGFRSQGVRLSYHELTKNAPLPCIILWGQKHFVVLVDCYRSMLGKRETLKVADPAIGLVKYTKKEFLNKWISSATDDGVGLGTALLLEPTPKFFDEEGESKNERQLSWGLVLQYLRTSKWQIAQIFIALLIASLLQMALPFLTQDIVDKGVNSRNMSFITVVLIAQLMLIFSKTIVDFFRSRLLLSVSSIVNISILSDFWIKLTRLPISYFDSYHTGDTLQRISDNRQVQNFLTGSALNTLLSMVNFFMYAGILVFYNVQLFFVFITGSAIYFLWIRMFLRVRRKLNYQTFNLSAKSNTATLQLVQGMQEIKLNGAEQLKRWAWESIQAGIFKLNLTNLSYSQAQQAGALFINQGKDAIMTFLVAKLVVDGQLTLGAMLAIQYIIGQLTSPVEQFVTFVQNGQDARISLERLNEIHQLKEEENDSAHKEIQIYTQQTPVSKEIILKGLTFSYPGTNDIAVLDNIDLVIPQGKTTAIVGLSGSGKTTLLKLLLKFYDDYSGEIRVGGAPLKYMSPAFWRKQCSSVRQDGFIFNDSIARNIAVGDEQPDYQRLVDATKFANILAFIESLPSGFNTHLGTEGVGISAGQRQRILIARALYRDPQYLFFDEATNALDANNERVIVNNLQQFFIGRTVVVIAHRLSTVKNADKIVVLHNGKIIEEGTHTELSLLKGKYFELVRNQLELGN